jgi:NADH:ubiquinone oxidoreductase subunit 3 (subunit A)
MPLSLVQEPSASEAGPAGFAAAVQKRRGRLSTQVGTVMRSLVDAASMVAVAVAGVALLYVLHRFSAVASDPLRAGPFLSGASPIQHAVSRFHVRWYVLTMLFLAFDVEMLFMYPWALVVAQMGAKAVIEMFAFLAVLMAGVVYAWREGALRWA